LTREQRDDLRLWYGRVNLLDRIKVMRAYALATVVASGFGIGGFIAGFNPDTTMLIFTPVVPIYMWTRVWKRAGSLRASGLRLRRVLSAWTAKGAFPSAVPVARNRRLERLV